MPSNPLEFSTKEQLAKYLLSDSQPVVFVPTALLLEMLGEKAEELLKPRPIVEAINRKRALELCDQEWLQQLKETLSADQSESPSE
jgi:hypothetical protein